ncbi:MAG: hypothetical protein CMJ49_02355 [Planctomycetaceae bacterium]|nr:hypothetical protein [Planctomycetaceae bacterium]
MAQDAETAPPPPVLADQKPSDYAREAMAYITANPRSPHASRMVLDLYTLAVVSENPTAADQMKTRLIFQYPASLQTLYVVTLFEDAATYRAFVDRYIAESDNRDAAVGAPFYNAMKLGLGQFGLSIFQDHSFLIRSALAAREVDDKPLASHLIETLRQIENMRSDHVQIVEVMFNQDLGARDLLVALHEIPDSRDAQFLETVFTPRLSAEDRTDPTIMRVLIDNHLRADEFVDALALIEMMSGDDASKPQTDFQRGWCNLAMGRHDQARHHFEQLIAAHPDDSWSAIARTLGEQIADMEPRIDQTTDAVFGVLETVRAGIGALEAHVEVLRADGGPPVTMYLCTRPAQNQFELVTSADGVTSAYRCDDDGMTIYAKDQPAIYVSSADPLWPAPYLNVFPTANGGFNFRVGARIGTGPDDVRASNEALLSSPLTASAEGVGQLVAYHVRRGWVPGPITDHADGRRTFMWLRPELDAPELKRVAFTIGADRTLHALETGNIHVRRLRYAQDETMALDPPAWPEVEVLPLDDNARLTQLFMNWFIETVGLFGG